MAHRRLRSSATTRKGSERLSRVRASRGQMRAAASDSAMAPERLLALFAAKDLEALIDTAFHMLRATVPCDFASAFYRSAGNGLLKERDSRSAARLLPQPFSHSLRCRVHVRPGLFDCPRQCAGKGCPFNVLTIRTFPVLLHAVRVVLPTLKTAIQSHHHTVDSATTRRQVQASIPFGSPSSNPVRDSPVSESHTPATVRLRIDRPPFRAQ